MYKRLPFSRRALKEAMMSCPVPKMSSLVGLALDGLLGGPDDALDEDEGAAQTTAGPAPFSAAASRQAAPEARGAVYQPVIDGWTVIRPRRFVAQPSLGDIVSKHAFMNLDMCPEKAERYFQGREAPNYLSYRSQNQTQVGRESPPGLTPYS